jgi:hypothetical protein
MNKLEAIEKVKRLRALAGNAASTIAEAATAAKIAAKILQENALIEADIEFISGSSELPIEDATSAAFWGSKQVVWQNVLLTNLCTAHSCSGIIKHKDSALGYYLIGRPADIATIKYQFLYFVVELNRLAILLAPKMSRGEGKSWHNSFYTGAGHAISEALKAAKTEAQVSATSTAMVIINRHSEEANALQAKLYPKAKVVQHHVNINRDGYNAGYKAGSSLNTHGQIGGGSKGLLK